MVSEKPLVGSSNSSLELPENEYMDYFGPDYRLHFPVNNMENENTKEYMDFIL